MRGVVGYACPNVLPSYSGNQGYLEGPDYSYGKMVLMSSVKTRIGFGLPKKSLSSNQGRVRVSHSVRAGRLGYHWMSRF